MTDLGEPRWTVDSGRVAAYDFTKKKTKPHWVLTDKVSREAILLQNYQHTAVFDLVCALCGHNWTEGIALTMRLSQVECPYCLHSGSVVRS